MMYDFVAFATVNKHTNTNCICANSDLIVILFSDKYKILPSFGGKWNQIEKLQFLTE